MPKRSRKPADLNRVAASIVDQATSEPTTDDGKDPAAVALGRKGRTRTSFELGCVSCGASNG